MTSAGKLGFSLLGKIFLFRHLAQPQSAQNIQDRYLFCLGLTGPNAALLSDLPQTLSVYCEVYRMIFSWAESLPSNTRG